MARMRLVCSRTPLNAVALMLLALVMLACASSSARAESWGEIKQSALTAGTGVGQIDENRLVKFAAGSNGGYYVLTEDGTREFVLQRYDLNATKDTLKATIDFKRPKEEEETSKVGSEGGNAIIGVDSGSGHERVYVLLVYERREQNEKEEKEEEKTGKPVFPLDEEMTAAGYLYAFEYNSGVLTSVKTNKEGSAPAITRKELGGQGEGGGEEVLPLLDPRGMTVDPATGDLAISGNQDKEPNASVETGAQKQCRPAVQFVAVKSSGAGKIEALTPAARYVDRNAKALFGSTAGCGGQEEEEGVNQALASPVFAPDGTLLGYGEDEVVGPEREGIIWQLTPAGADTHTAEEVEMTPKELYIAESIPTFSPNVGDEEPASVMSLVPESTTDGTLYLRGDYNADSQPAPLVLHYSHPTSGEPSISEVGWTAGGSTNPETAGPEPCDLHKSKNEPVMLGGLSGAKRGYLALTFYKEFKGANKETEVPRAEVVQFGEGGQTTKCPTVPVTTPIQKLGELTNTVPAGTPLEITSVLGAVEGVSEIIHPAAGAKSAKWTIKRPNATEEHPEAVYEYNGLHTEETSYGVKLKLSETFTEPGTYQISVKVHTDDLADEEAQSGIDTLTVTGGKLTVKAEAPEPTTVVEQEQTARLKALAEVPGEAKLHIKKVVWEFGDGAKKEEGSSEQSNPAHLQAEHAFSRCGSASSTKCKVKIKVQAETKEGLQEASASVEITVKSKEQSPPPAETQTTATSTTPPPTPTPTPSPSPQPKGGVQAYIASFSSSTLSVSTSGVTLVKIGCPSGGSCAGTLTLQTASAVAASGKGKKKVLTLAGQSFSLPGGSKTITLHLNSRARALLSRSHGVLKAKLMILSRGASGQSNTTTHTVTLHLLAKKKH
jgi:hypothetical protein